MIPLANMAVGDASPSWRRKNTVAVFDLLMVTLTGALVIAVTWPTRQVFADVRKYEIVLSLPYTKSVTYVDAEFCFTCSHLKTRTTTKIQRETNHKNRPENLLFQQAIKMSGTKRIMMKIRSSIRMKQSVTSSFR